MNMSSMRQAVAVVTQVADDHVTTPHGGQVQHH